MVAAPINSGSASSVVAVRSPRRQCVPRPNKGMRTIDDTEPLDDGAWRCVNCDATLPPTNELGQVGKYRCTYVERCTSINITSGLAPRYLRFGTTVP